MPPYSFRNTFIKVIILINIQMEVIYFVQTKGIKENKFNWNTKAVFYTLKEAIKHYNFYKGGCCKRILRKRQIINEKVMRYKKY